jgi:hypothetical protein
VALPDDQLSEDLPKVFLSCSRRDPKRAQRISDVLRDRSFGVFKDTDDILPTEEWRERLEQLIQFRVAIATPHRFPGRQQNRPVDVDTSKALALAVLEEHAVVFQRIVAVDRGVEFAGIAVAGIDRSRDDRGSFAVADPLQ